MLIPAPFWVSYPEMARLAGAQPVVLDCPASEGYMLTAQQLRSALTPRSRLLILCTPSNPTGAVYTLERLQVTPSDGKESILIGTCWSTSPPQLQHHTHDSACAIRACICRVWVSAIKEQMLSAWAAPS